MCCQPRPPAILAQRLPGHAAHHHCPRQVCFHPFESRGFAEAVQEVAANACRAYARLAELGKTDLAYPNVLARFGVAQTRDHRKVGGRLNVRDVLGKYCQTRKGVVVERLDHFDEAENAWLEILVEDRYAGPAAIAATRLDFEEWLQSLPKRLRKIATVLATSETTTATAKRFRLSPGRISQIRKELFHAWQRFVGEDQDGTDPAPVAA